MNRSGLITSNSVLTMLLDRLKREMPNKQPHNVMLREQILGFLEDLLGVFYDAFGGSFVEVVAGTCGLAEEAGELFGFGFEFGAVLFVDAGFVGGFDDLVG
ncbi:hypothetical protein HanRHA438_Chr16g0787391 [Helianthus annuus]|nr:hypothetical protein HanRHA438_Chr16g0787391 [Helianthus annuus]